MTQAGTFLPGLRKSRRPMQLEETRGSWRVNREVSGMEKGGRFPKLGWA